MKKQHIIVMVLSCIILAGCNYSKGVKKDLRTGLTFSYNGFFVKDVVLLDPANKIMTDNKVQVNTKMAVAAFGISNYGLKDGKVYPGMMLLVTDKKGAPVIKAADLFEGTEGYPPESATELRGDITIAKPMASGQTYHVKLRIWDKVKADNEINTETDLVVQ